MPARLHAAHPPIDAQPAPAMLRAVVDVRLAMALGLQLPYSTMAAPADRHRERD